MVRALREGAAIWGLELDSNQLSLFSSFLNCLTRGAARLNLTAIREPREVVFKHFLDSLTGVLVVEPAAGHRVIDIGSGAGFPGLPLKIARPELELTLLEASRKKVAFLRNVVAELGLSDVHVLPARAEEAGRDPAHRGRYDYALARAVAEIRVLVEYSLPLLRPQGLFVAYKGPGAVDELERAGPALATLGGIVRDVLEFKLPGEESRRSLIVIEKTAPTPDRYPRRPGMAAKRPVS